MRIALVRHAHAGDRGAFVGPDRLRPLDDKGERQAQALVPLLKDGAYTAVHSSPAVRCVQTVEPLATALGLTVVEDEALFERAPLSGALDLFERVGDGAAVFCAHGDLIPEVLIHLHESGIDIGEAARWQKASAWVFTGAGRIERAEYLPPPC